MTLLLGRYWPYMTPVYIWGEMDMLEVQEAISHVMRWELHPAGKKHYEFLTKGLEEWLTPPSESARQDLSWIKPPIGRVIRKNGN